jgi:hypothetical protein
VLEVHEIENLFLHPPTLAELAALVGSDPDRVHPEIVAASDRRAGSWIFDAARTDRRFRDFPEPSKAARELVHKLTWADFDDLEGKCGEIANAHGGLGQADTAELKRHLIVRARIYARKREAEDLWQICEGKEILRAIVPLLGFTDEDAAERAITALWKRKPALVPTQLDALREYIRQL